MHVCSTDLRCRARCRPRSANYGGRRLMPSVRHTLHTISIATKQLHAKRWKIPPLSTALDFKRGAIPKARVFREVIGLIGGSIDNSARSLLRDLLLIEFTIRMPPWTKVFHSPGLESLLCVGDSGVRGYVSTKCRNPWGVCRSWLAHFPVESH